MPVGRQHGFLGSSGEDNTPKVAPEGKVLQSELRAYCPPVTLREGTAFFNTYEKGGDNDPTKLIYQSSISAVTRSCSARRHGDHEHRSGRQGRARPGRHRRLGDDADPHRRHPAATEVLYSQIHKYEVAVNKRPARRSSCSTTPT